MDFRGVSKAIAGAVAAGIAGGGSATASVAAIVPPEVAMPWYGYLITFVVSAAVSGTLGYFGVYAAPANRPGGAPRT